MKVTQKKIDGGKYLLDCVASEEDVSKAFYTASVEFASQMGLRPQKDITVEQACRDQLGITDLDSMVQGRALELIAPMALDKKDIIPLFPPTPMGTTEFKRGKKFAFTMTVTPKPAYELTSYDPVEFTFPPFTPDLSGVDDQIKRIAEQYAGYGTAPEQHEVRKGDTCLISIDAAVDGVPLAGLNTPGRPYTAGEGYMPPQFDEAVIGMKPGETKTFSFEAPDWDPEKGLYQAAVGKLKSALEDAPEPVEHIYYIWLQGESDAIRDLSEDEYYEKLIRFKNCLKRDCGIEKFGIIRVGYFTTPEKDERIMEAQERAVREDPDFLLLTRITSQITENLLNPDFINQEYSGHYNNRAMTVVGKDAGETLGRYAKYGK